MALERVIDEENNQIYTRQPRPVLVFINPTDPQADELRQILRTSGVPYSATSAYSGVTEAEFGEVRIAGVDQIIQEIQEYYSHEKR